MPVLLLGIVIFALFDIYLSFIGWQAAIGTFFTLVLLAVSGGFRSSLLAMIGTYMGAVNVLGWPWWGGVLIACPGLLFILPAATSEFISQLR